jgi:nicotinate-nucleotide--dimethylbenzimidazole phosphoribosyltransferase
MSNDRSATVNPASAPTYASASTFVCLDHAPSEYLEDRDQALAHQTARVKPPGSLGTLEDLAVHLAAFQGRPTPKERPVQCRPAHCLLFAADHPVTSEHVSPYPSAVTAKMVEVFLSGKSAATVMAASLAIGVTVVDVGVDSPYSLQAASSTTGDSLGNTANDARSRQLWRPDSPALRQAGNLAREDAMSVATLHAALDAGRLAIRSLPSGTRVVVVGEMGIGNTTPAAAIYAALYRLSAESTTGRGTGADDAMLIRKRAVVARASERALGQDPLNVLRLVGGREIAAMVGAMDEAGERGILVLVDGFVASAAAAVCIEQNRTHKKASTHLVFAHCSQEQGHAPVLSRMGISPVLRLGMRLGEGSGALAMMPLLELACAAHNQMGALADVT